MKRYAILCGMLAQLSVGAWAQAQTTYHGCTDARGERVAAVGDATLDRVVASRVAGGRAEIRYNERILPRLLPESRLFLFAHECARHNLGLPVAGVRTLEDARRADCWGLESLLRSGLLDAAQIDAVEHDLQLSTAEWASVPGPARSVDLSACAEANARRHALTRPSPAQPDWNACIRACGERLRACSPRGPGCDDAYERCTSLCDFRSPP